jgi:hypothetical protein
MIFDQEWSPVLQTMTVKQLDLVISHVWTIHLPPRPMKLPSAVHPRLCWVLILKNQTVGLARKVSLGFAGPLLENEDSFLFVTCSSALWVNKVVKS